MGKWQKGVYQVQNPQKYIGAKFPTYRSSWEKRFCIMCDTHPNILKWASENIKIPYTNPATGRIHNYIPDFLIQYIDESGVQHTELIEIKPSGQTTLENARSQSEKQAVIINSAKWAAAQQWCNQRDIKFRVINEQHIFATNKKRKPNKRISKSRIPPKRNK
jgi:hypothetical protein